MPKICDPPPFQGGQCLINYAVIVKAEFVGGNSDGIYYFNRGNRSGSQNRQIIIDQALGLFPIEGKILAISAPYFGSGSWRVDISRGLNTIEGGFSIAITDNQNFSSSLNTSSIALEGIFSNQPDNCGDPPPTNCRCSEDSCRVDCAGAPDGFCCIDHALTNRLLQVLQN